MYVRTHSLASYSNYIIRSHPFYALSFQVSTSGFPLESQQWVGTSCLHRVLKGSSNHWILTDGIDLLLKSISVNGVFKEAQDGVDYVKGCLDSMKSTKSPPQFLILKMVC